ncbi:MAG: hypothetical protein U0M96_02550 [Eggerthellaceae bacterium]
MKTDELEELFNVTPEDISRWDADEKNGVLPGVPSCDAVVSSEQPRVSVKRDDQDLVSVDGSRRFTVYGDREWGWWIEIASDGTEVPGLWEYIADEDKIIRVCR